MKKQTIRVMFNTWGNYDCFIGVNRVEKFGEEYDAKKWLTEKMQTGEYKLSEKTYLQPFARSGE